jgi:histidinol-phosphate aminotransferase
MNLEALLNPQIESLPVYQPGRPIEVVAAELGLEPASVLKLASNENPLGPSPWAVEAGAKALRDAWLYPDNGAFALVQALRTARGVGPEQIVLGAGSNEIFYRLCDLFVRPGVEVVMGAQAFITYRIATLLAGGAPVRVPMPGLNHDLDAMRAAITERTRLVFLPNPNNPTGSHLPSKAVLEFARSLPEQVVFCYDEAYAEYEDDPTDLRPLMEEGRPIVATRTFSKIYGLAGMRIGYGYGERQLVARLNQVRPPFNTGSVAQACALAALDDQGWVERSREVNDRGLRQLAAGFRSLGLEAAPSAANFILVEVPQASTVYAGLLHRGVIVRPVGGYDLPGYLRISVGTEAQNARCLETLREVLKLQRATEFAE